jgi:hypothetical protein
MLAHSKVISLVLAVNLIAGGTYALAVQNTVADGSAVYKTSMVLGYDVTGITFDVRDTDQAVIDSITFHIAPSSGLAEASHVEIQTKADGKWTECSLVDDVLPARVATCTFESLAVEDVTALDIVAK